MTSIDLTNPVSIPSGEGFAALVFDWDGTMVDSREVNFEALRQAMSDCSVVVDPDFYWSRQSMASPELLAVWESQIGPLPEPITVIIDRCRQYNIDWAGTVEIIEPVAAFATAARARGQLLAVASNASAINLDASMTATGLAGLFDAVATWSDVEPGRGKPHPDIRLAPAGSAAPSISHFCNPCGPWPMAARHPIRTYGLYVHPRGGTSCSRGHGRVSATAVPSAASHWTPYRQPPTFGSTELSRGPSAHDAAMAMTKRRKRSVLQQDQCGEKGGAQRVQQRMARRAVEL